MKIETNTITIGGHTGYGNASRLLFENLESRKCEIASEADVMLNFCMPPDYKIRKHTIGYTPWESTVVPENWIFGLRGVDDLWTTSNWVAEIFKQYTNNKDIFVLPHGVESCWTAKRRVHRTGPFKFLHVGEPAVRKGGDIVLEAWYKGFSNRRDVQLVYKSIGPPWCRVKDSKGHIKVAPKSHPFIMVHDQVMSQPEMLSLYHECHALIYPSRGEGFGLIPLEAMATGLPTVLPGAGTLADFSKYAAETLNETSWVKSGDQKVHPGQWMDFDIDELIHKMECIVSDYPDYSQRAFNKTDEIHKTYSWSKVAAKAIQRISKFAP